MAKEPSDSEVLKEILVWMRVGFYGAARAMLAEVLNSEKKQCAYQAADGSRTLDSIRQEVKMSPNDITELYRTCVSLGLMEVDGNKRRRLFDLTHFGFEIKSGSASE